MIPYQMAQNKKKTQVILDRIFLKLKIYIKIAKERMKLLKIKSKLRYKNSLIYLQKPKINKTLQLFQIDQIIRT